MAITRLTDFVTVATNKWTYGDSAFKYEGEVNQDHDTIYPLMIMTPPTSRMPDIYEGWEHYNVEMEFYNTYQTATQNAVTLQQRWDNLQDLALEWLDNVLIEYSGGVIPNVSTSSPTPTQVYIDKESLRIDRVKNSKNDKLCRITMSFDMRMFTRCFTPKSVYPDTISDLVVWLSADSNVTFNIPTKKSSAWGDKSGQSNNVAQSTVANQPLRYGYDGASDKSKISFNGTTDYLVSDNNCPLTGNDLTIFYVGKSSATTASSQRVIGYRDSSGGGSDRLNFGMQSSGRVWFKAIDDTGNSGQVLSGIFDLGTEWHIGRASINNTDFHLQYNNSTEVTTSVPLYSNNDGFNLAPFRVGFIESGGVGDYWNGDIQEVIIYNKALSNDEISQVRDYLNNKYKIY